MLLTALEIGSQRFDSRPQSQLMCICVYPGYGNERFEKAATLFCVFLMLPLIANLNTNAPDSKHAQDSPSKSTLPSPFKSMSRKMSSKSL